jgi:RNA recognition motif-containing protein
MELCCALVIVSASLVACKTIAKTLSFNLIWKSYFMNQAKIYVGNLSYQASAEDLTSFFQTYGNVIDAKIITDRDSGRSKGFGFVTFETPEAANAAVAADGTEVKGRALKVSIAREQERTGGGAGGRGDSRGGGRGDSRGGSRDSGGAGRSSGGRGSW